MKIYSLFLSNSQDSSISIFPGMVLFVFNGNLMQRKKESTIGLLCKFDSTYCTSCLVGMIRREHKRIRIDVLTRPFVILCWNFLQDYEFSISSHNLHFHGLTILRWSLQSVYMFHKEALSHLGLLRSSLFMQLFAGIANIQPISRHFCRTCLYTSFLVPCYGIYEFTLEFCCCQCVSTKTGMVV